MCGDASFYRRSTEKFPSPCGVNIVANIEELEYELEEANEFPSPCGVNIVANIRTQYRTDAKRLVSVPLRGKYRGEWDEGFADMTAEMWVSVPLRGKYRGEL